MERPNEKANAAGPDLVPEELLAACRAGDEGAWRSVVELTYREVYTLCLRILRDPDDAAEATQDAYLKAWRGLAGFRGDARFTTWLYRVATNAALSKLRSRKRRADREMHPEEARLEEIAGTSSTADEAGVRIDLQLLERALATLPEQLKLAVLLRDVYGLSTEEAADRMGCSPTAAKVRLHRGRKKLKDIMMKTGGMSDDS